MKAGDRAIFLGNEKWLTDLNDRYKGEACTVLAARSTPFDDYKVAFDSFPKCNNRENCNWFWVCNDTLKEIGPDNN